jgi:mannose-6-phosphate isomerase-like protein (cupin superfamily)
MRRDLARLILFVVLALPAMAVASEGSTSIDEMLGAFVEDFRSDPAASFPVTFGVRVGEDGIWHVIVEPAAEGQSRASVRLESGPPPEPTVVFVTDRETLTRIYRGQLNSLTAMGKARSSDFAPLDLDGMEGFQPDPGFMGRFMPLLFHFWTRGQPEIIRFGDKSLTRELHGGNAVLFYYQPGFRSGWFQVEKGQHINAEADDQVNPFPTLLVITAGRLESKIGGEPVILQKGEALFIPPDVSHEFWNTQKQAAEGVLIMFGEGA